MGILIRLFGFLFGAAAVFIGIAGYLPRFMQQNLLFGWFSVSASHNLICIGVGVLAIIASTSYRSTKVFLALIGSLLTIAAMLSLWRQGNLYIVQVNMANNILYIIVGVIALYLGFARRRSSF